MKSLLDCPAEIVRSILKCLPTASLRDLCLVSRALREVAEPLLYADVQLIWLHDLRPPSFMLLLRNIQRRPQLAKHIQALTFSTSYMGDFRISVDSSELASLIAIIQDINPPFRDLWIQELENGTTDAFVMLFLSLAPNITYLRLTDKFNQDNRLLGSMLRASLCQTVDCNLPRFQYLRKVQLDIWASTFRHPGMKNTAELLPLFYLPAVQSISGIIDNPAIFAWPTYAPNPSNITSLHLRGLREGNLGRILATTANLKTLRWEWKYVPMLRDETNNNIINLDQIVKDLSHVQNTLEDLDLSGNVSHDFEPDDELQIRGSLRPLRRFEKLHKLVIPQLFLIGFSSDDNLGSLEDLMPKNIHYLTITDNLTWLHQNVFEDDDLFTLLEDWWENLQAYTPYFHIFKLELEYSLGWSAELMNELSDLCDQVDIRLEHSFPRAESYEIEDMEF